MKKVSFVVPVFRNEGSIKSTFDKISTLFKEQLSDYDYQVVFVNDGSDDGSLAEILEVREKEPSKVKVLSFSRNFGQVPALVAGFSKIDGEIAVNIAADLQDPVELIVQMLEKMEEGNKIVICYRTNRNDSMLVTFTSNLFYKMMNYSNASIPKGGFDMVMMDKQAVRQFNQINERNRFFQGDITFLGFPIAYIPFERLERTIGKSQWNFTKKLKYFIDGLLNTSYFPIRAMSFLGLLFSLFSFVYSIIVLVNRFFFDYPFKGYAPIVILLLGIGGLIMVMLGIIGEYIWRIYDEVRDKPYYIIDKEY